MGIVHLLVAVGLAAFADALTVTGMLVAFAVIYVVLRASGDLFGSRAHITRLELGIGFTVWFIFEVLKASIDVARIVLARQIRTRPAVVAVRLQRTDDRLATVIGCLVTLTPGTLTLDYDPTHGLLYVHALDAGSAEDVESAVHRIENRLLAWIDAGRAHRSAS